MARSRADVPAGEFRMFMLGHRILAEVAVKYEIPLTALTRRMKSGPTTSEALVRARMHAILAMRDIGLSLPQIARVLRLKDHTTILHHIRKVINGN